MPLQISTAMAVFVLLAALPLGQVCRGQGRTTPGGESLSEQLAALHNGEQAFLGALACNATACHGSQVPHRRWSQARGNEFVLWSQHDPHAGAAATLNSERSQAIMQRLGVTATEGGHLSCVGCHRPVNPRPIAHAAEALLLATESLEGVSCEACHGPAEQWLATHFRGRTTEQLGKLATDDLLVRARLCADCHVGSPHREVNHDLIAAGHPPMRFEFASYYQKLPKHWHDDERNEPQYYERLWSAGTIASAEAALALLEARATRASSPAGNGVWPEFAEYACYDCHRSLTPSVADSGVRSPGVPAWNSAPTALVAHFPASNGGSGASARGEVYLELNREMSAALRTDPARISQLANQLHGQLNTLLAGAGYERAVLTGAQLPQLLIAELATLSPSEVPTDSRTGNDPNQWEWAAKAYAALAVLEQSYRARHRLPRQEIGPGTAAVLQSRRKLADWFVTLGTASDPAETQQAQQAFLTSLLEASRRIQQRGE